MSPQKITGITIFVGITIWSSQHKEYQVQTRTCTHHTHTHTQRIKVNPQLHSPKLTEEEKSGLISNRIHANGTLTDAYCLSSTCLQRFPGELRATRESLPRNLSPAPGRLLVDWQRFSMSLWWKPCGAWHQLRECCRKAQLLIIPNRLQHSSPQVLPKSTLLGLASGATTQLWIRRPSVDFRRLLENQVLLI